MTISTFNETTHDTLPDGFTSRPARMTDLLETVAMFNDCALARDGKETFTVDTVRSEWESPLMNLDTNTRVVLNEDKDIVAYIEVWDDHPERTRSWGRVHPVYQRRGLGTYLLRWAEAKARSNIARCAPGDRVVLHTHARKDDQGANQLFQNGGMKAIRHSYLMKIVLDAVPEPPALPDGFSLRMFQHPNDLTDVIKATIDIFRDHWGFIEPDFEQEIAEWQHMIDTDALFDPKLWLLAVDDATGEIAGLGLNRIEAWDDSDVGYVWILGVRRAYRQRGLGHALLRRCFKVLYDAGKPTITLHVDAGSLTGATRLYEKAGMHVEKVYTVYEKELRPGKSVMTEALDG